MAKWIREVNILVLDLYFRGGNKRLSEKHSEVIRLSELLKPFDISPSSINMALGNYQWLDTVGKHGLKQGEGMRDIWEEFSRDRDTLAITARAIEMSMSRNKAVQELTGSDEKEFLEGDVFVEEYLARQRNSEVVSKKKQELLNNPPYRLICEVCNFDFVETYGEIGQNFAECHHRVPLSDSGKTSTKLSDLAIVCANCHRMLHTARPVLTVEALRKIVMDRRLNPES